MQARIAKRVVDGIVPGNRDIFVWDIEAKGFGLKITPKGRRTYIVQTRINGRLRRFTIGQHGSPWTPDKARREAIRLLGLTTSGLDPYFEQSKQRADLCVAELCDAYVEEGCRTKKPNSLYNDAGLIRSHIKPLIGSKRLSNLTRKDIERMMADIAAGKTAADKKTGFRGRSIVKGGEIAANNAVTLLSSMLSFAVTRALITDNPVRGIKKYQERARERFLSQIELGRLGEALTAVEKEGVNQSAVNSIWLLLLSGCRKNEILSLRWSWVDFEHCVLRLPDSKTGAKAVPLGQSAIELLRSIPRNGGSPFVFPGGDGLGHFVGLQKVWERLRARADLDDVRLNDLRHTYASVGASSGESLYIVGKIIGH